MTQINFTKEHLTQLQNSLMQLMFKNQTIKGMMATTINAHQLLNETSIKTLQQLYIATSKDIENQSKLDRWSMTNYQQTKLDDLKSTAELLDLLIGYKKSEALREANFIKLKEKKELLQTLKDQSKTPEVKIKELEAEISELEA